MQRLRGHGARHMGIFGPHEMLNQIAQLTYPLPGYYIQKIAVRQAKAFFQ